MQHTLGKSSLFIYNTFSLPTRHMLTVGQGPSQSPYYGQGTPWESVFNGQGVP